MPSGSMFPIMSCIMRFIPLRPIIPSVPIIILPRPIITPIALGMRTG